MKFRVLKCGRCSHEWVPRRPKDPKVCPVCKRQNWNTPKSIAKVTTIQATA